MRQPSRKFLRPRMRALLAAALLAVLVLSACGALAASAAPAPVYSPRVQAIARARDAVCRQYGFTPDTLGFFAAYADAPAEGDDWVVSISPIKYGMQLGGFTVRLPDDETPQVRWSLEEASEADLAAMETGALDSELWGHRQLEAVLAVDAAYGEAVQALNELRGDPYSWTLEDRAALDSLLPETGYHERSQVVNILPGEGDLQPEEAAALSREALEDTYQLPPDLLDDYHLLIFCFQNRATGTRTYSVSYLISPDYSLPVEDSSTFFSEIDMDTRETSGLYWSSGRNLARVPDGPLEGLQDAVTVFLQTGALDDLTHAQRMDFAQRLSQTSYGRDLLGGVRYAVPGEDAIDEKTAEALAWQALEEAYGFTRAMGDAFFLPVLSFQHIAGADAWVLTVGLDPLNDIISFYGQKLGQYRAVIDARDGSVRSTRWSLADVPQSPEVAEDNWAEASTVWDAQVLTYALALQSQLDALAAEYPGLVRWDEPDYLARWSTLFRQAGYDVTQYALDMPAEGELTRDEAIELAKAAFCDMFDRPRELLDTVFYVSHANYAVNTPDGVSDAPCWHIELYPKASGRDDFYLTTMDARTGEILAIDYVSQGNG